MQGLEDKSIAQPTRHRDRRNINSWSSNDAHCLHIEICSMNHRNMRNINSWSNNSTRCLHIEICSIDL